MEICFLQKEKRQPSIETRTCEGGNKSFIEQNIFPLSTAAFLINNNLNVKLLEFSAEFDPSAKTFAKFFSLLNLTKYVIFNDNVVKYSILNVGQCACNEHKKYPVANRTTTLQYILTQ